MTSQELSKIAIVGMACRFPGSPDLSSFWKNLVEGANCTSVCPPGANEGRVGELYADTSKIPSACRHGAFLTDIDQFDAEFFRISPSEAEFLDPQQRMMLETSWQALENANIDPESLRESSASVYAGMSNNDYRYLILGGADTSKPAASLYTITGTSLNTAIGRVSFALGFEGPAMTIDTACSSSLVAMHEAVGALQTGESDVALAGGVQLILSGKLTELRANAGMLSPDGTCKTFDESANGYVRGEGCGIVVLKRLEDAERDGDHIWACVAATAINQDGSSEGLTVPRELAQKSVISAAIDQAQIRPSDVDYLEAHGTGTPVGDPIEINAAAEVYGEERNPRQPLLIGSVKTNMGHLEPAAGVAGVIKVAMSIKFGLIPKHLNFKNPSSAINWDELPVKVVDHSMPWPQKDVAERLGGINSFGFSGTNAHVILQGYGDFLPESEASEALNLLAGSPIQVRCEEIAQISGSEQSIELKPRNKRILPVSGKSHVALQDMADTYSEWVATNSKDGAESADTNECSLENLAWTASVGRSHFNHRKAVVFESAKSLIEQLGGFESLETVRPVSGHENIAFVYTGQGSQWAGMGLALYETEPVFRATIDRCEEIIQQERNVSLIDAMFGRSANAEELLEDPAWVQPSIYALECALTDLWKSIGIQPSVVVGHSLGEIAAARTAGVFSLEDGCRFASARGRLMSQLPGPGLMAAVFLPEEDLRSIVNVHNETSEDVDVSVAALNGTHQVLSGYQHLLEPLLEQLENDEVRVRRLKKSPAYHSALVEPILDELEGEIAKLDLSSPILQIVSNVTGDLVPEGTLLDGKYWRRHARQSIEFRAGIETVASLGTDAVLEIGPDSVLGPMAQMSWPDTAKSNPIVLSSLQMPRESRPERPLDGGFFECVAQAYDHGFDLRLEGLYSGETRTKINIPGYVFQRSRHWVETRRRKQGNADHELLGSRLETPRGEVLYESEIFTNDPKWLNEHRVYGQVIVPGAFFGSMSLASSNSIGTVTVDDLQLHNPMVFMGSQGEDESDSRRVQLICEKPDELGKQSIEIFSKSPADNSWVLHATGSVSAHADQLNGVEAVDISSLQEQCDNRDLKDYYEKKSETNIQLGSPFRNLKTLHTQSGQALAEISIRDEDKLPGAELQPLLLDSFFQVLSAARESAKVGEGATYIPFGWEKLSISLPVPESVVCHAQLHQSAPDSGENGETDESPVPETVSGDLWIGTRTGRTLGTLKGLILKRTTRSALLAAVENPIDLIYDIVWRETKHPDALRHEHPLAEMTELKSNVDPFFDYLKAQKVSPEERVELLNDLEFFAQSWVASTLEEAGLRAQSSSVIDVRQLMSSLQIEDQHEKLLNRMLEILVRAGVLEQSSTGEFSVALSTDESLPESLKSPEQMYKDLQDKHPHGMYELSMLNRFGSNMIQLLKGEMDPLALLFEEDSPGATDFYRTAPVSAAGNRLLGDVIARLVRDLPEDRPLRVIEVGAGTGATTEIVFEELREKNLEYMYTDISAGFFFAAEQRFADSGLNIEYLALDIEHDPIAQGFKYGHYDIVIAANVLHATIDLCATLSNCRELLAPGGFLVALESLKGRSWQDMTFGFLDGWWRYDDAYRKNHALASPDIWRAALKDAGYVHSIVFGDETISEESGPLGSGTVVGQAPKDGTLRPGTWIIEPNSGNVAIQLQDILQSLKQEVLITRFEESPGLASDDELLDTIGHSELLATLESLESPLRGVIHLASMDGHDTNASVEELADDIRLATGSALSLTKVLMESGISPTNGMWFVTSGAQVLEIEHSGVLSGSTLWGFGKVVGLEAPYLNPRMVDIEPSSQQIDDLLHDLLSPTDESHIAFRRNTRYTARLVAASESTTQFELPSEPNWIVSAGDEGSLSDVGTSLVQATKPEPRHVQVHVEAAGLNFSDVLVALGAQVPNASLGLEFSGYISDIGEDVQEFTIGQRVFGMGFGTFGPQITTHADLVAHAPDRLTLPELATIPIAFATVAVGFELAGLKRGDRVLVHSAAGGVGLAAVQLVRSAGAEVFATASQPKQEYLRSIGINHIFDSRTTAFSKEILDVTDGEGVDIVLNSLTSEGFIDASLACLGKNGRFVEIGRLNIFTPEEMSTARPDVDYHIVSLDDLKRDKPEYVGRAFRPLVEDFVAGSLKPIRHSNWPIVEVGEALQFMGSARHIGKLVLTMSPLVRGKLRSDRTYLVTGGMGGIGCAVAEWLAEQGATNIVLNGRREPDPDAKQTIQDLAAKDINIVTKIADITDTSKVESMIEEIDETMPPLGGVIHSVGVLSDGSLQNQSWERFEQVLWPKVLGAWLLHQLTKGRELDMFVLFSSAVSVLGNAGQANHAAANAFLDQLAAHRRAIGLPGQSIAWGAWSDIGEAAEQRERIASQLESSGTRWISPEVGIRTLEYLLRQDRKNSAAMSVDWSALEDHLPNRPSLLKDLLSSDAESTSSDEDSLGLDIDALRECETEERESLLVTHLQKQIQAILRLQSLPSPNVGFFDLGMDSLMAVELRNRLNRVLEGGLTVSQTAVFDYPDVESLAKHLSDELTDASTTAEPAGRASIAVSSADNGKIAVVGMACRVPGADSYSSFWTNIANGVNALASERNADSIANGIVGTDTNGDDGQYRCGFVSGIDEFDAQFFRIRPIDARAMDPRQRMLLETCWEAIEDAAIEPSELRGSRVGVYVGMGGSEYRDVVNANGGEDSYIGTSSAMTTGRLSYIFGLTGPAMSFDLACASSLVAIHEGVKALQSGEVDLALVGGVNALLSSPIMRFHQNLGLLSKQGRCLPFDQFGDGYVRGEGCGILLLKRHEEALNDGDPIWSTLLGSAVNQNGPSAGLTIPNGTAQEQVMRDALIRAGVPASEVDYVEAHANGLPLSDPIELRAASSVYASDSDRVDPLLLGSIKSSVGHLEWAAGSVGVIRVILSMRNGKIPAQLHLDNPNEDVDWEDLKIDIARTTVDWPSNGKRIGAVSAFGMSGTNAHVLVESNQSGDDLPALGEASVSYGTPQRVVHEQSDSEINLTPEDLDSDAVNSSYRMLPLSGKNSASVAQMARKYISWLDEFAPDQEDGDTLGAFLADVAWTASIGRDHFGYRQGIVFSDLHTLLDELQHVVSNPVKDENADMELGLNLGLIYRGATDSSSSLLKGLYKQNHVVQAVVDHCNQVSKEQHDVEIVDSVVLAESHEDAGSSHEYITTFLLQLALSEFWNCMGQRPTVIAGEGIGLIAALCHTGSLSISQSLELLRSLEQNGGHLEEVSMDEVQNPRTPVLSRGGSRLAGSIEEISELLQDLSVQDFALLRPNELHDHGVNCVLEIGSCDDGEDGKTSDGQKPISSPRVLARCLPSMGNDSESMTPDRLLMLAVKDVYEAQLNLRLRGLFTGEMRRKLTLPTYAFQRRQYWFND